MTDQDSSPEVAVIMGSENDLKIMLPAIEILKEFEVEHEVLFISAHRLAEKAATYFSNLHDRGFKVVITGAGMANHLSGTAAARTILPVIGVPINSSPLNGADSLYATVQMPPGIPVATVGINAAKNAALLAVQILALNDYVLAARIHDYRAELENLVEAASDRLTRVGPEQYVKTRGFQLIAQPLSTKLDTLVATEFGGFGTLTRGKVRDIYRPKDGIQVQVTTDRQSAFDHVLGAVPFKGAVLNQLAYWWFERTKGIIPNHVLELIDPNTMVVQECEGIPVEMIVRAYMTGSTETSIWTAYNRGERNIYGIDFPDGLVKNQALPEIVITPTTHAAIGSGDHDEKLTRAQIIEQGIVLKELYEQMEEAALALFRFGTEICADNDLILVDTKYEFGLVNGELTLMDEIHTPDSSRFWFARTYPYCMQEGEEPDTFDKEFLRLWLREQGYNGTGEPPQLPDEIALQLSQLYMEAYAKITGESFQPFQYPIESRIKKAIRNYL